MRRAGILLLAGALLCSFTACNTNTGTNSTQDNTIQESITQETTASTPENIEKIIYVRYTDENYKNYFEYCEKAFEKANPYVDIRLSCEVENSKYIQNIIDSSYGKDTTIDVYMLSDNNIGIAYLSGIAAKNPYDDFSESNYCKTALRACSYGDLLIGYPLSFDTTILAYRSDFMSEKDVETFENIKSYAENADYSSEELSMIESIYRHDLNDLFINYGFVGAGMNIGGKTGIDANNIDLANADTLRYSENYIDLIEYFNISQNENYDYIVDKFTSGKYLSTIISTKDINALENSEIEYSLSEYPNFNKTDKTSPLAITQCLAVNQNSDNIDVATDFARFATYEAAGILYEQTGCFTARRITYSDNKLNNIYSSYEKASNKNKIQYGEQIYPLIEIALHNIVSIDSEGAMKEFENVEEYMKKQLK